MEFAEADVRPQIIAKSPQELAAQIESVYSTQFVLSQHPAREELDKKYKRTREYVEKLQEQGVDNETLSTELDRLYKEGRNLGLYVPNEGKYSKDFLDTLRRYLSNLNFTPREIDERINESVANVGFLTELRNYRRRYEKEINSNFDRFVLSHPLDTEEEQRRIAELSGRCIYTTQPEADKSISENFLGGNFLFHSTKVEQAVAILESGEIVNAKTLIDQEEEKAKGNQSEKKKIKHNSGYEGISWNFNDVGAMPGDRYHMVGFLTAPNNVLNQDRQLVIPSRPAANELILINGNIDSNRYYEFKTQYELLITVSLGESNSVWGNIAQLSLFRQHLLEKTQGIFSNSSMLQDFVSGEMTDKEMADLLRSKYSVRENGTIQFSTDLLQQPENKIPLAAVWFQALIDTGRIRAVGGFSDKKSVRQVVESVDDDNYRNFAPEFRKERDFLEKSTELEEEKVAAISVPVSETYLVVPDIDLKKWLRVLTRCNTKPKGILVYGHNRVRLENFASLHKGDNQAMTEEIRKVVPVSDGYVDYEKILGARVTSDMMAGSRRHVIGEPYLAKRKTLRKDPTGNLIVV